MAYCSTPLGLMILFLGFGQFACAASPTPRHSKTVLASMSVEKGSHIAETDEDFICATLDWWPPQKCDYGTCSWGLASLLNLDLQNPLLAKAMKAFSPLKLRLGGSLQDQVIYAVGKPKEPCEPFVNSTTHMFGFSGGCLHMQRWDSLNALFKETGVNVVFGLNALYGRDTRSAGGASGPWDSSNARDFIHYTVQKGYKIQGWELGNELCGSGVGTNVSAKQYAADVIELHRVVDEIYKASVKKPLVIAPGGFFDADWFKELLQLSGPNIVNVLTHHIYNLGAGVDLDLVEKIMDPSFLSRESSTFNSLEEIIEKDGPWSQAWVGEAGGAYNSGHDLVSNAFIYGFWYLDQLGMSATYNTKAYCRQTLIGGNYGLLNRTTYAPNPDYYNALLWHRLMGTRVLAAKHDGSQRLRAYAHCSRNASGVTLLLMNYSNDTRIAVSVETESGKSSGATKKPAYRMEYHLTAKDGNIHSQSTVLNGKVLDLTTKGDIPALNPTKVDASRHISLAPLSIAFVQIPHLNHSACMN